jgi:uncharacterized repeat protein (TIGR03803 family)
LLSDTLRRFVRVGLALATAVLVLTNLASAQVSFAVLDSYTSSDAVGPALNGLILATDGNFYGTSSGSAANRGTVFKMTSSGTVTVLHAFAGGSSDGDTPKAALLQGSDGTLYGTTSAGGAANLGTVFKITTSGVFTFLHSFVGGASDGADPEAVLIQARTAPSTGPRAQVADRTSARCSVW